MTGLDALGWTAAVVLTLCAIASIIAAPFVIAQMVRVRRRIRKVDEEIEQESAEIERYHAEITDSIRRGARTTEHRFKL